jgi:hypothetical protein
MWQLAALLALSQAQAQAQEPPPPRPEKPEDLRAPAEANTAKDFVRFAFNFYSQKDNGGNPNLDEDMTVLEPQILVNKALSDRWMGSAKFQADIISAASIEKGKRFPPNTQTGASGDKYFGVDLGAFYAWSDQTTIGGGATTSTEYDYKSFGGYLKWTHDTASRNDTFLVRLGAYQDTLDIILFNGLGGSTDDRTSISLGLGWTHVLGPQTLGTLNWDLTSQSGFLSTPYNSVVAAGTEVQEILPDSRLRNAVHARVRHLLWDNLAVEPGLGAYFDDWGATAFNFEFMVFWEAMPGALIVRPWYRFHSQTEVDDFLSTSATTIPEFRTQDSDLADFTSHTVGVKLILPRIFGGAQEFEVGVDYTMRSDDLDSMSLSAGWQWRF